MSVIDDDDQLSAADTEEFIDEEWQHNIDMINDRLDALENATFALLDRLDGQTIFQ